MPNIFALWFSVNPLKYPKGKIITVTGQIKGSISYKILGSKGFGYDPIFIPLSEFITFGQMSKAKKIRIDHSQHKPAALTPVEEKKQQLICIECRFVVFG